MIRGLGPLRHSKKCIGFVRLPPFTVSLAASGISLQAYASYMLVKTGNISPSISRCVADL